jgi:hypothetical protein
MADLTVGGQRITVHLKVDTTAITVHSRWTPAAINLVRRLLRAAAEEDRWPITCSSTMSATRSPKTTR